MVSRPGFMGMLVLIFISLAGTALAQEPAEGAEEKKALSDSGEISYVLTSGNAEAQTLSVANTLSYDFRPVPLIFTNKVSALRAETEGEETAARYTANGRLDWKVTERFFTYAGGRWERDTFAGIENRYGGGAGVGYILAANAFNFKASGGIDYVVEEFTQAGTDRYAAGLLTLGASYQPVERTTLAEEVEFFGNLMDAQDFRVNSISSLQVDIVRALALKVSYQILYDNEPAPGFETTDTIFTTAIVVTY